MLQTMKRKSKRKEEQGRTNPSPKEKRMNISWSLLLCVINSKNVSGMKAHCIEENEKTVDKKDNEEFEVSKLKPRLYLNASKYIFVRD